MRSAYDFSEIYLHRDPVDFRKWADGLVAIVKGDMQLDPFSSYLFLFTNRRRDRIKALYWDKTGYAVWYKRLEEQKFMAKVKVTDHLATKYHCPVCNRCVKTADLPASPIDGSIATPSLLAHVATSKFADGLPLYRQEGILKRTGLEVSRTTLATLMIKTGELLRPFYNLLGDAVLEGDIIYMDETHLQVLATPDKVATAKSYLWARVGGVTGQEVVHFHFDPSRSSQVPKELLQGYRGYVVTDDCGGYDFLSGIDGVIRAQCWMHARRYFHRAWKALGKAGRGGIADQALTKIRKFYQLERSWADEPPDKRRALREEQLPVFLQDFHQWLQQAQEDVPPKGKTGVAIRHALKI